MEVKLQSISSSMISVFQVKLWIPCHLCAPRFPQLQSSFPVLSTTTRVSSGTNPLLSRNPPARSTMLCLPVLHLSPHSLNPIQLPLSQVAPVAVSHPLDCLKFIQPLTPTTLIVRSSFHSLNQIFLFKAGITLCDYIRPRPLLSSGKES